MSDISALLKILLSFLKCDATLGRQCFRLMSWHEGFVASRAQLCFVAPRVKKHSGSARATSRRSSRQSCSLSLQSKTGGAALVSDVGPRCTRLPHPNAMV